MGSKYWIKLYHEILDDPIMGRMSDRLYRRCVELFLLAGDTDQDGLLPSTHDIAWRLRLREDELETDLADLAALGILHMTDDGWIVTNFSDRQAKVSSTERTRRWRERQKEQQYYGDGTEQNTTGDASGTMRPTDTDTDKIRLDKDTDKIRVEDEDSPAKNFDDVQLWLEEIVKLPITPADIQPIQELTTAGITRGDIRGALQWRKDNSVKAARTVGQLKEGIITNRNKRIQDGSARKSSKSSAPRMTKRERSLAALEEARKKSKERESKA